MFSLSLEDLNKQLTKMNLHPKLQEETNQIYVIKKISDKEYPVFFRIFEGSNLLQMLAFIPCTIKAGAENDLARLLHMLNKELDIPGFGMDEGTNVVFFRIMVPADDKRISSPTFETLMNSMDTVCKTFSPVVATVAFGLSTFDQVLKKIKEHQKGQS